MDCIFCNVIGSWKFPATKLMKPKDSVECHRTLVSGAVYKIHRWQSHVKLKVVHMGLPCILLRKSCGYMGVNGGSLAAVQFIKSRIFFYESRENLYQCCKSRVLHLNVQWNLNINTCCTCHAQHEICACESIQTRATFFLDKTNYFQDEDEMKIFINYSGTSEIRTPRDLAKVYLFRRCP